MTPFQKAHIPQTEFDLMRATLMQKSLEWFAQYLGPNPKPRQVAIYIEAVLQNALRDEVWKNDIYQVAKRSITLGDGTRMIQLSIKRLDREPCHDWRDFQQIKSELVGPECEGVELFPAESRVIDTVNQYFLWVLVDPTLRFPFGIDEGKSIRTDEPLGKAKNRPFRK